MGITADLETAYVALQDGEVTKAMQIIAEVTPKIEKLADIVCADCGKPITERECENLF